MSKRGSAEGTIYKRKDERWVASFRLPDGRRKSFYGKTRGDVATRLRDAQHKTAHGLPLADDRETVTGFLYRWLEHSAQPSVRPRTYQGYVINVERHILPALGRTRLVRLTPDAVQAFLNSKSEAGLRAQTVRNIHATLRRALNQAVRWGIVERNVASLVSPPRYARTEIRPLTVEQARSFLDATRGDRLAPLYQVALALGLRQGEALGLRWEDVDLEVGRVTIQRALQRYGGEYHLGEPKTARSRRTLGVPAQLVEMLRAHRNRQRAERLIAGGEWQGDLWGLVFCREDGAPLSGAVVTHRFQKALADAGLPRQRFHDLRHAAASFMLAEGVPLRVVMEVLGHSEIGTTANIYGHIMPELAKDATDRVGRLLWTGS